MAEKEESGVGKAALAGVIGGGTFALIDWLRSKMGAPAEGVIFTPDEWTKETLLALLARLIEVSSKLTEQINVLNDIKALLGGGPTTFRFEVTPIEAVTIPGLTPKNLYLSESPHSGAIAAIELVSNSRYVEYELHIDDIVWTFNVSDMIDSSIEYPHFPGGWIAKATGATFVFMFSSGATMDVKYKTNFSLVAKATSAADVTISRGELVRKVYDLG